MKPSQIKVIADELRKEIDNDPYFIYYVSYCKNLCISNYLDHSDVLIKDFLCFFDAYLFGQEDNIANLMIDSGVLVNSNNKPFMSIDLLPSSLLKMIRPFSIRGETTGHFILFKEPLITVSNPNHFTGLWHAIPLLPDSKLPLHKAVIRRI